MEHLDVAAFLGRLCLMLGAAKGVGLLARAVGQPSVLGELLAGILLGPSLLGLVDPSREVFHLLGELGVVILLFSIGLESDLSALLKAGPVASVVAVAGVVIPFGLGYVLVRLFGVQTLPAVVVAAALTATSVGITARVLADLGRLGDPEGQVILAAAILDDVLGLVILTLVANLSRGRGLTALGVGKTTLIAFGFLGVTLLIGRLIVPRLTTVLSNLDLTGGFSTLALMLAFGLGWLADRAGSAVILGAFAAGLLVAESPKVHDVELSITRLGRFFVPLFFVMVGAAVDVSVLNPLNAANHQILLVAAVLTFAAVVGKFAAGYAAFWFKGRKSVVGAGMVPRGEVGLIFAQLGRDTGVLERGLFAALTVVVMATTLLAPPLLKFMLSPAPGGRSQRDEAGIEELATEG
jgi:Kef-type K+ transport system membrane component KefB